MRPLAEGVRVRVRVTPRARTDALGGTGDDAGGVHLKARIAAPPADGEANGRLVRLIAGAAGVGAGQVRIASGMAGRVKSLVVSGDSHAILERLHKIMEHPPR